MERVLQGNYGMGWCFAWAPLCQSTINKLLNAAERSKKHDIWDMQTNQMVHSTDQHLVMLFEALGYG